MDKDDAGVLVTAVLVMTGLLLTLWFLPEYEGDTVVPLVEPVVMINLEE